MLCFDCDAPATQLHHVVPRSLGGSVTVPLCDACHDKVHGLERGDPGGASHAALVRLGMRAAASRGARVGRPSVLSAGQVAAVRELRAGGLSWRAVADGAGCSVGAARRAVACAGGYGADATPAAP